MRNLIGRLEEKRILEAAIESNSAELVAIYGRRRVGKTFLVRTVYEKQIVFEFTGVKNAKLPHQLENFSKALKEAMSIPTDLAIPNNWPSAFDVLKRFLEPIIINRKAVIFFDEFPWINSAKSNFLNAFEHFWNTWASKYPNLTVVICGSAASWMIQNIVKSKGGLHNRVSIRIKLSPFTLNEAEAYLKSRSVKLDRFQLLQLYMVMGGIAQYLSNILPGESATQAIDRICFTNNGYLHDEFDNLYSSLFDHSSNHINIVKSLAKKQKGLSRKEIIAACNLTTGGRLSLTLEELEESGFISSYIPFGKTIKELVYRLTDEYSLFYLKYMGKRKVTGKGTWLRICQTPTWNSWSGYAFEGICLKHILQIKKALGIDNILVEESVWTRSGQKNNQGAQIDLLLNRDDHCINICEIKFTKEVYAITQKYAEDLERKKSVFVEVTKTTKTIFLTMITTYGTMRNPYFNKLIQNEITMNDLFAT